ncbi:unnamed protein product [Acanthoscelides obtectus]|uniref:Uncharacterized protein n=1 Tax=Acanthoscelides obtectus TaxID=200917 RepID=A0A9P0MMH0_ACAOB|nr:unnamed protein product [Acanthoscelides obtectus]CAK1638218.1 hypothetical protein AOBTE_LOCUS10462 [Acanthoscelides obtectus]
METNLLFQKLNIKKQLRITQQELNGQKTTMLHLPPSLP